MSETQTRAQRSPSADHARPVTPTWPSPLQGCSCTAACSPTTARACTPAARIVRWAMSDWCLRRMPRARVPDRHAFRRCLLLRAAATARPRPRGQTRRGPRPPASPRHAPDLHRRPRNRVPRRSATGSTTQGGACLVCEHAMLMQTSEGLRQCARPRPARVGNDRPTWPPRHHD